MSLLDNWQYHKRERYYPRKRSIGKKIALAFILAIIYFLVKYHGF